MTVTAAPPRPLAGPASRQRRRSTYGLKDVMRSEWTKLTSVRSTRWTMVVLLVLTLGIGIIVSIFAGHHWAQTSASDRATFDSTNTSLSGLAFGSLAVGVLGVLVMSGEYATGLLRSTLSAVPKRGLLLVAKAIVFGLAILVVGELVTVLTFLGSEAAMGAAPHASLGDPTVARAVLQSGAFLSLIGLLGLGLGTIIRHSAGAIAALVGLVLVLPVVIQAVPGHLNRFGPEDILSSAVAVTRTSPNELSAWVGFALMGGYALVALVIGGIVLSRRDV